MKTSERTDIDQIGRKLAVYGTYICNRQHHATAGHICSFLVCPRHDKPYSQAPRPEISITLTNQEVRKQRKRVRFCKSGEFQISDQLLYPLDQELMEKLSGIQLDPKGRNENPSSNVSV